MVPYTLMSNLNRCSFSTYAVISDCIDFKLPFDLTITLCSPSYIDQINKVTLSNVRWPPSSTITFPRTIIVSLSRYSSEVITQSPIIYVSADTRDIIPNIVMELIINIMSANMTQTFFFRNTIVNAIVLSLHIIFQHPLLIFTHLYLFNQITKASSSRSWSHRPPTPSRLRYLDCFRRPVKSRRLRCRPTSPRCPASSSCRPWCRFPHRSER